MPNPERHAVLWALILFAAVVALRKMFDADLTSPFAMAAVLVSGATCFAIVYFLLFGTELAKVFIRAIAVFVPIAALTGFLITRLPNIGALSELSTDALTAGIIVAAGWVVTFVTGEWRRVSAEQDRRRDIIRACMSELELIIEHNEKPDWRARIQTLKNQYRVTKGYRAFIYYGHNYETLKRLALEIEILRWEQIPDVMNVIQLLDRLDRMQIRICSDEFAALPAKRQSDAVERYLRLHSELTQEAQKALKALKNGPYRGFTGGI